MSAAEAWNRSGPDMPGLPEATAAWIRETWVPRVSAFLRQMAPLRPQPGSADEAAALESLARLAAEAMERVGPEAWNGWFQAGLARGLTQAISREPASGETERKLALRFLQRAFETMGEAIEAIARLIAQVPPREFQRAMVAVATDKHPLHDLDAVQRGAVRCQLDLLVAFESVDGDPQDLAYWSRSAMESSRKLRAVMASPDLARRFRGDLARIRARNAWADWGAQDIATEFGPWPQKNAAK